MKIKPSRNIHLEQTLIFDQNKQSELKNPKKLKIKSF